MCSKLFELEKLHIFVCSGSAFDECPVACKNVQRYCSSHGICNINRQPVQITVYILFLNRSKYTWSRGTQRVQSLPIACRLVLAGGVRVSASIQPAGQRTNRSVAASGSPGMGACHFHGMRTWGAWEVARGPFPHVSEPRDLAGLSPAAARQQALVS